MADTNYNVKITVSDNGTSDNVKKSIKDLNNTVKDLSAQSTASTSSVASFSDSLNHLSLNSAGARRELIVLVHELSTGNFTRFSQSLLVMAQRMDALSLVFSPAGIAIAGAVAALGVLAVASVKGAEAQNKLNAEIALTGNYAGTTSGNLRDMSLSVGEATHNFSGASEAIGKLTMSGRFTVEQIQSIGTAAANMSRVTGQSIDKIVGEYLKLADAPTQAAYTLNKQYNFLTVAIYDQIAALEKQGRTQEAAALAADTLSKHQTDATKVIEDNMGTLQRAAAASSKAFHEWWNEVLGIGRKPDANSAVADVNKQIAFAQTQVNSARAMGGTGQAEQNHLDTLIAQRDALLKVKDAVDANAAAQGKAAQQNQLAIAGENYLNTHASEYTSKIAQRKVELDKLVQAAKDAGKSQTDIDKIKAGFNANAPKDNSAKRATNNDLSTQIEAMRGQIDSERIALRSSIDSLTADYDKGNLTYADYVKQKADLQAAELQKELDYTKKMEALSKGKVDVGGVEAQRYINQEADLALKIKEVHDGANKDLAAYAKHAQELTDSILKNANNFNRSQSSSNAKALSQYFMTDSEKKNAEDTNKILDEYVKLQADLNLELAQNKISQDAYAKATQDLSDKRKEALDNLTETIKQEKAYQADFASGWDKAFRQYVEDSNNAAKQASEAFSALASDMETALTTFVTTGKLSFSDFARSVLADIARIAAKSAASGIMKFIGSAVGSYFSGGAGGAVNASAGEASVVTMAANGGVFEAGMKKFASGGVVVTSPTTFPMANGTGQMAEAGPEAIMPLTRDSSGRLGVSTSGGGGGLVIGSIVINVQGGQTNDQTAAVIKKEMVQTMTQIADGRIANAKRPGGLLATSR